METFRSRIRVALRAAVLELQAAWQDVCKHADLFHERARQEIFEALIEIAEAFAEPGEHLELVMVTEVEFTPEAEPQCLRPERHPTLDDLPPRAVWSSEGGNTLLGIGPASRLWLEPGAPNRRPLN